LEKAGQLVVLKHLVFFTREGEQANPRREKAQEDTWLKTRAKPRELGASNPGSPTPVRPGRS